MEIDKKILIGELKEKIESQSITINSIDSVVDTLFSMIRIHIKKGDRINIQEFSVRSKGSWKSKKRTHSQRSGSKTVKQSSQQKSQESAQRYSSNFFVNEMFLIIRNRQYLLRKIKTFFKLVTVTVAFITVYYLLTIMVGF